MQSISVGSGNPILASQGGSGFVCTPNICNTEYINTKVEKSKYKIHKSKTVKYITKQKDTYYVFEWFTTSYSGQKVGCHAV